MVYENLNIPLVVIRNTPETEGYRSIFWERPKNFTFESGDWMELAFPGQLISGGSVYSFSSSPNEPYLRITFRDGISPFKKALQLLQPGDTILLTEYGNDYGFQLRDHGASILIAGGVGIAPFRSMIQEMYETGSKNQVLLIYFDSNGEYLFADEFIKWQQSLDGFQIYFINTKDVKRKERERLLKALIPKVDQRFYVSGPSGMILWTKGLLEANGVARKNIKVDDFGLY